MSDHDFDELVIDGPHAQLRAFVSGWAAGTALDSAETDRRVLWCKDHRVHTDTAMEKVVEALRPGEVTHLLVRDDTIADLLRALRAHGAGLKPRSLRPVLGARLQFQYEILSRPEAEEVLALFAALPAGVHLSADYHPVEEIDPSARGVEMYSPAHDFVLRAHGTASGPLPGILALQARAAEHERIHTKEVVLDLGPPREL